MERPMLQVRQVNLDEFRDLAHSWGFTGLFLSEVPPDLLPSVLLPYVQEGVYHVARYRSWTGEQFPYRNYLYRFVCVVQPLGYRETVTLKDGCLASLFLYRVAEHLLVVARIVADSAWRSGRREQVWLEAIESFPLATLDEAAPLSDELAAVIGQAFSARMQLRSAWEDAGTDRYTVYWGGQLVDLYAYLREWLIAQAKLEPPPPLECLTDCVLAFCYWTKFVERSVVLDASLLTRFSDALRTLLGRGENPYVVFHQFLRWVAYRADLPLDVLGDGST